MAKQPGLYAHSICYHAYIWMYLSNFTNLRRELFSNNMLKIYYIWKMVLWK